MMGYNHCRWCGRKQFSEYPIDNWVCSSCHGKKHSPDLSWQTFRNDSLTYGDKISEGFRMMGVYDD